MKSVHEIWQQNQSAAGVPLLGSVCKEILEWQTTGVLADGRLREFSSALRNEGYPAYQCLDIAKSYVLLQAAEVVSMQ